MDNLKKAAFVSVLLMIIAAGPNVSAGATPFEFCSWQGGSAPYSSDDWDTPGSQGDCGFNDNSQWCYTAETSQCPDGEECTVAQYCQDHDTDCDRLCIDLEASEGGEWFVNWTWCPGFGDPCEFYCGCSQVTG